MQRHGGMHNIRNANGPIYVYTFNKKYHLNALCEFSKTYLNLKSLLM
jgi:hypothetical protein